MDKLGVELASTSAAYCIAAKRNFTDSTSSDESTSSDDEILFNRIVQFRKRHRIQNYMQIVSLYDEKDFQAHFRLNRTCVELLINQLAIKDLACRGRPKVPLVNGILFTLCTISNQESFRSVSDRFNFSKGHGYEIFIKICKLIYFKVMPNYICWPKGQKALDVIEKFNALRGLHSFPNVLGCVDGTHIPIPGPKNDNSYYNRKGYNSIILQAICDADMLFIDIYSGWPGSSHDARVWKHSPIYNKLPDLLPQNSYLLGDTAYPLTEYLIVPFRDNGHLTRQQKRFNRILSSSRVLIEQAYGRLKGMFRRLKYLHIYKLENAKFIIATACVLHNITIKEKIEFVEENVFVDDNDNQDDVRETKEMSTEKGKQKRIEIMNQIC